MISVVVCLGFAEHELPASSYRLGVQSSPLHDLLPAHFTLALKQGLIHFNDQVSESLSLSLSPLGTTAKKVYSMYKIIWS